MKHLAKLLPRDEDGRTVLGQRDGGCRWCGAIREYTSRDGRAIVRIVPPDCCPDQIAHRRKTAPPARRPYRRDIDG